MLTVLGGILVCLSTTLIGVYLGGAGGRRSKELLELKKSLILLKSQIDFAAYTLPQAFAHIAERATAPLDGFYRKLAEAPDSWEVEAVKLKGNFHKDDLGNLALLGASLGQSDSCVQINSINMVIATIDETLGELAAKNIKETKMYRSLGVVSGLLITIALL
ncbi:MAG: stage III sporulation protein AB [Defluviitaleaceae bacterium]|nr:stage III sporulation protein AB [Defluviitaleaceae bacterium]